MNDRPKERQASTPTREIQLTVREQEILTLLGRGLSNHRISRALEISPHTVRTHLQAIFRKLGANQRTEAIALAVHAGLLTEIGSHVLDEKPPPPAAADLAAPRKRDGRGPGQQTS